MSSFRLTFRIITTIFVLTFLIMAVLTLANRQDGIQDAAPVKTVSSFECEVNGSRQPISLPQNVGPLLPRTPVTLFTEVQSGPEQSLYVKSVYAPLRLYANNVLIYESGQPDDFPAFLIDPPTQVAIVPLPKNEATVQLRLEFLSSIERETLALHPLLLGTDMSILQELLRRNGPSLVFAFVLLFLGTLLTLTGLLHMRGESDIIPFFWIGLFAFATGAWVFGECNLTAIFVPYPSFLYLLSFFGLFTVGIPLIQLGLVLPNLRHKLPLQVMSSVLIVCTAGAMLLQGFGLVGLRRSMYLIHITLPAALILLCLCMAWEGFRYKNVIARRMFIPVLVVMVFTLMELLSYRLQYFVALSSITMSFQVGALLFVLLLSGIGGFFLRDSRRTRTEKQRLESELGVMERAVRMQKAHYADLNEKIDAAIRYRHDERHHLQALYNMWENKEYDRIGDYLKNHLLVPPPVKRSVLCPNLLVDATLQFYASLCKEGNVDFICGVDLPVDMPLSDAELSILWGNLLENAWEAASNSKTLNPSVRVQASYDSDTIVIRVENAFAVTPVRRKGHFLSTKHPGRGVGTESVKSVVGSHGGHVVFTVEQNLFRVSVVLPRQTGSK